MYVLSRNCIDFFGYIKDNVCETKRVDIYSNNENSVQIQP